MATTDNNLQVINSMTQEQMQSLKDSSGKIPSLANQLIMTDDEDVTLDCLRTEVIYDMNDPNKNWGYTNGLLGTNGVTYNNDAIDFNKYESFRFMLNIYPNRLNDIGSSNLIVEMGHKTLIDGYAEIHGSVPYIGDGVWQSDGFKYVIRIGQGVLYCRFYYGTTGQDNSILYRITQIEGVLKTPAMIYTGAELNEGNGISIKNGVISVDDGVMGVPSDTGWVELSISGDTLTYKAPSNGFIYAYCHAQTNLTSKLRLFSYNPNTTYGNSKTATSFESEAGSAFDFGLSLPVKKGDIAFIVRNNMTINILRFIPCEV